MKIVRPWGLFVLLACSPPPPSVVAQPITRSDQLVAGPDAMGGMGDWLLANDVVTAVIDDVSHQTALAPGGGTLIDFAQRGAANDHLVQVYQVFMLSQDLPVHYDTIRANIYNDTAQLVVSGSVYVASSNAPLTPAQGAAMTVSTTYTLNKGEAALHVSTQLTNGSAVTLNKATLLDDVWLWGNRSLQPFAPYTGRGFAQPNVGPTDVLGGLGSYLFIAARGDQEPPVSYGSLAPQLSGAELVGLNTGNLSALGPSPLQTTPLPPGGTLNFDRLFMIGAQHSIESVAAPAYRLLRRDAPTAVPALGALVGRVLGLQLGRSADVVAQRPDGALGPTPVNAATLRAQDAGFYLTLPAGTYQLTVQSGSSAAQTLGPFTVQAGAITQAGDVSVPPLGMLQYVIHSDGQALPARLTLRGAGNADPALGSPFTGLQSGALAYSVQGAGSLAVEPGTYHVYASRGPQYSLAHQLITVVAGQTTAATWEIERVVRTPGWVAADFHVHAQASLDSSLDPEPRITAAVAEDVNLIVMTDHDMATDLTATVQTLQLDTLLRTQIGVESTAFVPVPGLLPASIGHNNAWPLRYDATAARRGAPLDEQIEPGVLYERQRAAASAPPVVQLNHPYCFSIGDVGLGYLGNFNFNPNIPIPDHDTGGVNAFLRRRTAAGHDNLSFDAMEVLNGTGLDNFLYALNNRDAWFSLLKQGFVRTGTGVSDSHTPVDPVGYARTYVRTPNPADMRSLDVDAFNAALLQQHAVASTGPFIDARVGTSGPGDRVNASDANITLSVSVQAPAWMVVDEVRVVLNGRVVCSITTAGVTGLLAAACPAGLAANPNDPYSTAGALRYQQDIALALQKDSFVLVEAGVQLPAGQDLDADGNLDTWDCNNDGSIDAQDASACADQRAGVAAPTNPLLQAPAPGSAVVPGLMPWAFTNPILIHLGDAATAWQAPGL